MSGARLDGTCCCTAPQLLPSQALLPQPLMFLSWRVCCCAWWNAGPSCRCPSHSRRSEVVKLDSAFPRNSGGRSTLFPVKEESTKLEALSGGHFVATHPSPAFEDAYWVCRPSSAFTHATPFAQCSFGYSGTGET